MTRNKRFFRVTSVVMLAFAASAFGVNVFYNEAYEARGLDRATFQAFYLTLLVATLLATIAVMWFWASTRDEVVSTADRASIYWGWTIGAIVWFVTPWLTSLPEWLVDLLSNPDGDTLFTFSEATGAYLGGGLVLILIVSASASVVKACWWLAKR